MKLSLFTWTVPEIPSGLGVNSLVGEVSLFILPISFNKGVSWNSEILFLNKMNEGSPFKFPLFCILGLWIIIFEKWGLQIQPGGPSPKIVSERVWERQYKYFIAGNSHESLQKMIWVKIWRIWRWRLKEYYLKSHSLIYLNSTI